ESKSDGQGDRPKDTHQDADGDASNETMSGFAKKLKIYRARLKDLEQLAQEPGMGFASEATTKLHEQIVGRLAHKEATLPACDADVAVRRRLRGAEKAQTKADAQVAKLKRQLEDIQTQLHAAQNKAEQAGKKVESLRGKEKSLARRPMSKGWDSVCVHLELAKTALGSDGEEQDAEVTKQVEAALALVAKKKANAAEKTAVAMDEDGASLSGDGSRYKRRACAGPEEQGEDALQLKAKVFITCNANTPNKFEKVLHQLRYQVEAPVVFDKEHQLAPKQVKLLSARLSYGWKAVVVPSAPTKEGMPQAFQLIQKVPLALVVPTGYPAPPVQRPRPLSREYIDHEALNAFWHDRMYVFEMHWTVHQCFDGDGLPAHSGHGVKAVYKMRELVPPAVRDKRAPTARARMKRVALYGCYTEGNFWERGIVAGSAFSPLCLSLGLIGTIDDLYVANPRADMCPYFDDLEESTRGDVAAMAAPHMKLTVEIVLAFEQVLKRQLSRGRDSMTAVAVSHGRVEWQLGSHSKQMGILVVREAVHLGVAQPAERQRRVGAQSKRIMNAKARSWNTQWVKAAGGAAEKMVKLGSMPSEFYGTRGQDDMDTLIATCRQTVVAAAPGCYKGRSTAPLLLAEDADPAVSANAGPIVEWARAGQDETGMDTRGLL
ncbi:unnamed protein product, partial [Prorocentrum cordatum]